MKNTKSCQENKTETSIKYLLEIYPTDFAPGKFYSTSKIHKLSPNDTINELPLRLIVSNIGTATYHLSKYVAELLSPLSESEYTIKNAKHFVEKIKKEHTPNNYLLVSFHVKSLLQLFHWMKQLKLY